MRNIFSKLHQDKKGFLLSAEIDEFLINLGYDYKGGVQGDHIAPLDGLSRWYTDYGCDDLYHTHMAIFPTEILLYQEYSCGGLIRNGTYPIPDGALDGLVSFKEFLEEFFEERSYYFGG